VIGLRGWVLVLAGTSFAVGLAGGVWLSARLLRPEPERGPFADYRELLVDRFELSEARADALDVVLAHYAADLEEIKDRHMADYMSAMEPELAERGRYYRDLVRNEVLPEGQRARFESPEFAGVWAPARP
jgi:hypothetical protein